MVSDEKMTHIVHLMIEALEKSGHVTYHDKELAMRESKKACFHFLTSLNEASETARKRILSQKSPPPEYSPQWDTLFRKYHEEELRKKGG